MSITSGFFNSKNGDRRYNAEQMSSLFDGLISEGVFATCGEAFAITPGIGRRVSMAPGRAWLNHKWILNDSPMSIDIPENSSSSGYKVNAIVLDVDTRDDVRAASVGVISDNVVYTDWNPSMTDLHIYMYETLYNKVVNTDERKQYIIAFVLVGPGETSIDPRCIFYRVGMKSSGHPHHPNFVAGIVDTITADLFLKRLEASHAAKLKSNVEEFKAWFADLKTTLSSNVAASITSRMIALEQLVASYPAAAEMHRNIFRGKYLGDSVTDLQLASIRDGTFDDLYVGDYWTIDGYNWRIVDIDYWHKTGDTPCTSHHLVIMPDTNRYFSKMNSSATSHTGYAQSVLRTQYIPTVVDDLRSLFGNIVLTRREYFSNAASNGTITAGAWYDSIAEVPNEIMIFGTHVLSVPPAPSALSRRVTVDKTQLALFRLVPRFTMSSGAYWLRDIASDTHYAMSTATGMADYMTATNDGGVRPVFAIG